MPTEPLQALPEAERRRRQRDWGLLAGGALVLAAAFWVRERIARLPDALPFADSVLFLLINVSSIVLIVLLIYLIGRQFVKLVFERRRGVLGSHLNLKFTAALFLVATVPTLALYTVSSTFIQGSFESWFTLQMDRAVEQSREVADAYYTAQASDALHFGAQISEQITDERMLRDGNQTELEAFIKARQREYNLGVVQVFPFAEEEPLATLINPDIPSAAFVARDSTIVAAAFKGERVSIVESTGTEIGDVIRGAVPIFSSDPVRPGEVVGALVVNHLVPHPLVQRLTNIRAARDEYSFFKSLSGEIAGVYQLVLLLFALVFVLLAIWWGLRMARAVTGPINALAEGTERVARGDLAVVVQEQSNDEIGMLVRSFNQMTHDLREALTGLEESNNELEQRRRYMEIVLRNVDAGVASVDAEGRIGTINPSALRLLGIAPGTPVVGSKLAEVLDSPELLDVLRDLGGQTRAGIRESVRQQVLLPKGDEALTLVITLSLLQDEEGRALGSVIVFDDYTQEVRAQRMAAWREVARRIAHEIKNPLTPIQLSAQRIRRRFRGRISDDEDAQVFDEAVDTIMSHVEGLKVLVNEFSQFARLPAANPKPDDLNQLVQEAVSSYAGTERVRFEADLDETLPSVEFDREQIRRVLTNLLDNASAACAETGGEVVVRTLHDSPLQTARVEVTDNGVGIPEEERRRIFEPYYSTKPHGTGLGLAIVSRIVADHHGYIRVHPNKPTGTRFILELPIKVT
jgi:two-component system nitrogen regulation sensor histidine kinase NtrY